MIKSYLINMQRSSDRLQAMSARFQALGMPFERIPAFDGATLTPEQIADFVRERPLEGSGDGFSTGPRKWTASNIGCFLSHQAAWRIAADSDDAYTAIFEDDMHLSDAPPALLCSTEWLPAGNSIVRLEPSYNRIKLDSKVADIGGRQLRLVRPSTYQHCWPVCAGALIISRDAARLLLAADARWHTMADIFLFGWNESPVAQQLSTYQLAGGLHPGQVLPQRPGADRVHQHHRCAADAGAKAAQCALEGESDRVVAYGAGLSQGGVRALSGAIEKACNGTALNVFYHAVPHVFQCTRRSQHIAA